MPKVVNHETRRREITEVAIDIIARGGMEAATIREIASACGYSKGVVEHYFDNKEAIISAALALLNGNYNARAERCIDGLRGISAIQQRLQATLPLSEEQKKEWRVRLIFWSMAAVDAELKKQQAKRLKMAAQQFAQHFKEAVQDGELPAGTDTDNAGRRLVATTTGLSIAALHNQQLGQRKFLLAEIDHLIDALPGRRQ